MVPVYYSWYDDRKSGEKFNSVFLYANVGKNGLKQFRADAVNMHQVLHGLKRPVLLPIKKDQARLHFKNTGNLQEFFLRSGIDVDLSRLGGGRLRRLDGRDRRGRGIRG